jgi:tetratricopeptide (TPR) repeat protein
VSLSAAVIVQDDADWLDACLGSVRPLVDEIVVVDCGSRDPSVDIARAHGAHVVHESWTGDFAAVRNRALDAVTCDWIISIDADEQVIGDVGAARAFLPRADGCTACLVNVVPRAGWTPRRELRLWRHRPDVRFRGSVHETVVPALEAAARADGLGIEALDVISVRRTGGAGRRAGTRGLVEPALVAELTRDPDQPAIIAHLGRIYDTRGDRERALDTWKQGILRARARGVTQRDDRLLYLDLVQQLLAHGVIDDELDVLVREASDHFARLPTVELAAARLAFATGRPRDALAPLDWLVGLDDDAIVATGASYDERVFGEWAWELLGLCHFALGDDVLAADAYGRAERLAPDDPSYGVRRRLAEARAATPMR